MLEGLVAWVLNNYLGKYVENLNTDQLSIALLSGEVELENLPLKKDALRHFGVPIEVQAGFIGKVKLQIPVRQIRSAPWVIVIEQLYLVATPVNLSEWDNEAEEFMAQDYKLSLLDALEAQWRAENESQPDAGYYASSFSSWMNYGTSLVTNIVENLQLKIKDVHLRYEDSITCGESNAFACGLIMESFSAESCDSNWLRSFTTLSSSQSGGCSFKLLELQKIAFYWDRMMLPTDMLANLTLGELAIRMCEMQSSEHRFVISPVSAVAHLRRERSEQPLRSHTRPRLDCQLSLDQVPLILTNCQYNEMIGCSRGLMLIGKLRVFRQWRPSTTVQHTPRAWWIYAVKCHFPDSNFLEPKPTWETCLCSARLCKRYVDMYSTLLITPSLTLSPENKVLKDQVEWTSPFQQLKLLREAAMRNAPSAVNNADKSRLAAEGAAPEGAQGRSMLIRWFPQWWGWYSSAPSQTAASLSPSNSAPSLEGEILDVLADSIENNSLLKRDTVFGKFQFNLSKGSLQLCEDHNQNSTNGNENKVKLELKFENVGFSVESRPRTSSHTMSIALGAVYLKDHLTDKTLFPILIGSQGTVRDGLGSAKFAPAPAWVGKHSVGNASNASLINTGESLFQLVYEKKPVGLTVDYRLFVKSQSLEIVYNPGAVRWLVDFLSHPLSINNKNKVSAPETISNQIGAYVHVKNTTKMHIINQWEHILQGNLSERSLWHLELDISAPQILLIEKFTDKNGVVVVLDFGKMHLSNGYVKQEQVDPATEDDENEMFMTPCSTPPGSEVSDMMNSTDCGASPLPADFSQGNAQANASLNQDALHHRLYDRYKIEFSDLQVLIGRVKDSWKYANTKGTSALHILDRFSISLQVERRVIYTSDPQFPSVTLCGTLPNLVVHFNEHKLMSIQSLIAELKSPQMSFSTSLNTMPLNEAWKISPPSEELTNENSETEFTERSHNQLSKLLMVQFAIDQLALEVQSRGRSIAEVQVCGVRAALTKRPFDFNLSLSVHSLLLVDALQTYGPDFELLIASHKHVGMDSVSGSIRDSEPTSPMSPSSPPECYSARPLHPPPPAALSQALQYLNTQNKSAARWCVSPTPDVPGNAGVAGIVDSEALIVIEVTIVTSDCPTNEGEELRIANILFNNLDIIANQETIVELIGFAKRVSWTAQPIPKRVSSESVMKGTTSSAFQEEEDEDAKEDEVPIIRTEITFDFHRLSVLLLRASIQDGNVIGKKIATATMSDAKIQATVANKSFELKGSLGGLQIVSLCPGTTVHQRIVSVGHDPLAHQNVTLSTDLAHSLAQEVYGYSTANLCQEEGKALSFNITKNVKDISNQEKLDSERNDEINVGINIHMASVWYTHSGIFIGEIQSCATEFKQYLSNLAKSIKAAATDMAIGLVQTRGEPLYSNPRVSGSMEWTSPRRPRSISIGIPQDSDASIDIHSPVIHLEFNVVLETPVVVLPRTPISTEVFVAHLGTISITNKPGLPNSYDIHIRDINVYSLDIANHLSSSNGVDIVESIYKCGSEGKPILHDTTLHLTVERTTITKENSFQYEHCVQISGKVVTPLKVSSTRHQYEQMLETVSGLGVISPIVLSDPAPTYVRTTDSTGVTTLDMDPQLRAQIFRADPLGSPSVNSFQQFKVDFKLPIFTVELRKDFGQGEQSLVNLSFRDFFVNFEKCQQHEMTIEMSLRSITMEDLLRDADSRHRFMMVSHKPLIPKANFVSRSSPDLRSEEFDDSSSQPINICLAHVKNRSSLPDQLHNLSSMESKISPSKRPVKEISSLPQDNLVLISIQIRDPLHPQFFDKYKNIRKNTKIDFNCLDLIISVESWVVVLDFFGMGSDKKETVDKKWTSVKPEFKSQQSDIGQNAESETEILVRSLNVVLLRPQREVCRANISGLQVLVNTWYSGNSEEGRRRVEGTLSSMSLTDLSPHGRIWRERFLSSGKKALNFQYVRFSPKDALIADCDTSLLIEMSSVVYVHTKRFVGEIQAFYREFSRLQNVISQARQKVSVTANSPSTRMQLSIKCLSPAILVPVSSRSTSVLVADLQKLTVNNVFKRAGFPGTISIIRDQDDPVRELLDVMTINLVAMDLYCGERVGVSDGVCLNAPSNSDHRNQSEDTNSLTGLSVGPFSVVLRNGPYLLTDKCGIVLQVERNLEDHHNVADLSIQGTLNTLDGAIDLVQYKVIKGLLSKNLGENTDDLYISEPSVPLYSSMNEERTWTQTSIRLDLQDVTLSLETQHGKSSLACINFIKSRLIIETFSDMTQDIDLVSQEILVSDTRYKTDPANKKPNIFSKIVQPMRPKNDHNESHSVQAEVHARKRREHSAYTILINNMRLMAIFDWWQAVNEFIMSPPTSDTIDLKTQSKPVQKEGISNYRQSPVSDSQFELKLNITETEVVFVEDTSQWDTNAVILKSTTVISYKPGSEPKPLSCILNHCEVFSCVLGMEEETELSIIDPVTVQIELNAMRVLQVQIPQLSVRLSYHDVRMLLKMFQSLPQQTRSARAAHDPNVLPVNQNRESIQKLCGLGFSAKDCATALSMCDGRLEQAALWLTEHSMTINSFSYQTYPGSMDTQKDASSAAFDCVQVKAECISICVIDDCRDSDVPLLEISLSEMILSQDLRESDAMSMGMTSPQSPPLVLSPADTHIADDIERETGPGGGKLQCKLTSDYYNRALSGWEPFIEPWRCDSSWEYGLTSHLRRNRLQMEVNSTETLNINITSSFIDLYKLVKENWTQDYYSLTNRGETSPKSSPPGYRRRSPFVPFAVLNQTGNTLWFTTIVTTADVVSENVQLADPDESWLEVSPGQTEVFKFGSRGKQRHRDSHKLRLHQLGVRIDGWNSIIPVCVDKVGVFFRHAIHTDSDIEARVVFAVSLEGSARKLVTVRSALQLINQLPETIEVRADNVAIKSPSVWTTSTSPRSVQVKSGDTWCVPLSHNPTPMWVRPLCVVRPSANGGPASFLYCAQPLDWRLAARQAPEDTLQLPHVCHSNTQTSYRFCCIIRREHYPLERGLPQPGHVLILKPPVRLVNLLPVELNYKLGQGDQGIGRIAPGQTAPLSQIDVQKLIEISIYMEGFPGAAVLAVPPTATASFSLRLKLSDMSGRKLNLSAHVSIKRSDTIKVTIYAAYWIVNRTGVPIVFRQEGVPTETAGQFEEHEIARMVAPLLFSFADSDGSPTVVARVGAGVIPNGQPQWCSSFGLGSGIMVRRLVVGNIGGASITERVLLVGIAVRPGRGRYRHTNICTISPRFQIHNNTSFHLQFAQKFYATTMADPGAVASHVSAVPGCSMPFHWPRQDRDQLLCVRLLDMPNCNWSGGFRIDTNHSLHINIRDSNAACFFLRLEVVLQGATFFIVFTDADTMPPPIRLDNYSLVPLTFHQVGCKDESLLKAHTSKPWALIEPCGVAVLLVRAPGGTGTNIDLHKLDEVKALTYQNFIYIAFTGTHQKQAVGGEELDSLQLVLAVEGDKRVVLARRRTGERSQLWRLSPRGHLLHEGSSPPQSANALPDVTAPHALVLDIDGPAPQPSTMVGLCVRKVNPRRTSTQTWHFTDGQLRCDHKNMNVQPRDGFFGLRQGNRAMLGLPAPPGPHILPNGVPIEQAISSQSLRPGSGSLSVTVVTDGPTRVVKITDSKQPEDNWCEGRSEGGPTLGAVASSEVQLKVAVGGVGLSLVSRAPPLELLFCFFSGVLLETVWSARGQALNLSVQDVQWDNQLLGTPCPVLLHSTKTRSSSSNLGVLPIIQLLVERTAAPPATRYNAHIFKHFILTLRPISVHLEERLLLKLCLWAGIGGGGEEIPDKEEPDETDFETQKILSEVTAAHAKRYYFGVLRLVPSQIRLSMQTAGKMSTRLVALKRRLSLTLIKFEDAGVELEPFIRWHPFETSQFLWHSIIKHYRDELKWQAAIILGSVDFLGNPLGFVQDVSDGVSGLIYEGNVGALVKNVTHGLSNSAAKVTESLGDGLGRVILDEAHEETRARIRGRGGGAEGGSGGAGGHLAAGLRGLGLGLLGGVTSLVKHSYEGAQHQGLQGFLAGVGKGLVGTVTKPVVGVLDLAAETAAALRDTSRSSERWVPERSRPPRCPLGPGGLLPRYSRSQSTGRQYLYSINNRDYQEGFLAYECIRGNPYDIRALISTKCLRIFTCTSGDPHIVTEIHLSNLHSCQAVASGMGEYYIELVVRVDGPGAVGVRRPQVQCDTGELARWVMHQVNYAKCMFSEKLFTLQEADYDFD